MKFELGLQKTDYDTKNVLNLYKKKHLVTLEFHVQQFTIGMMNLIGQEITLKMNLVLLDQQVQSLQKNIEVVRQLINVDPKY